MKTQTFKYYIYAVYDEHIDGGIRYLLSSYKFFDDKDYILISEHEAEHETPNATSQVADKLGEKRDAMRAAANAAITEVDNQIASLLAIEHKEEA